MYLGITIYEDWIPVVCDRWSSDKGLGGAGRGSGVGHFETDCWYDVQCGLCEMWMCGGGRE